MRVGDVVSDRFLIERPIGQGGMGSVYLAMDRQTEKSVAIKVLGLASDGAIERFRREAQVLSELRHPGIVEYIAHGETDGREPFLVMELLEGEVLTQRLTRGELTVEESLCFIRRTAEALAFAHSKGVIHRDVKPGNLFLVGGDVERVKVLDFGIARATYQAVGVTQTGAMLGTVGYMAPEQATGDRKLDPRVDVFALGCVFFECLAGRPAFPGEHAVAIFAKLLVEEPPRLRHVRPELPDQLDDLTARMLSKEPARRPPDAMSVLREVDAFVLGGGSMQSSRAPSSVVGGERRLASVIVVEEAEAVTVVDAPIPKERHTEADRAAGTALEHGAELRRIGRSTLLLTLQGAGVASDHATRAAHLAIDLSRTFPEARIAVGTGFAELYGQRFIGPAIDRAVALLRAGDPVRGVLLDEVTAGLLGPHFDVVEGSGRHRLVAARQGATAPRTLLGRPTRCVGRAKELGLLKATLDECIDERAARCVLVTAAAGMGKSRLARELMDTVRAKEGLRILFARAAPVAANSVGNVVSLLVRDATGSREADPPKAQHARIREHVSKLGLDAPERIAQFLSELVGAPWEGKPTEELDIARRNPDQMRHWLRRSCQELLEGECARGPVMIVLEDVHWADPPSIAYVGGALRQLEHAPLFVLSLGRPEARDCIAWPRTQELSLPGISRRASTELARTVLKADIGDEAIERIVDLAEGNAFFLEELIRSIAMQASSLPETVLAMAQVRLEQQDSTERKILRAASAFGDAFWEEGVAAIMGEEPPASVRTALESLERREVVERVESSKLAGAREYHFRHSLLREAAYASLTDTDKQVGHSLAGPWLEAHGERDPLVLANHFERAGNLDRAAFYLGIAADRAKRLYDLKHAAALYMQAYATMEKLSETPERKLVSVDLAIGIAEVSYYSPSERNRERLQRALAITEEAIDPDRKARVLNELGRASYGLGRHQEAVKCFEEFMQLTEGTEDGLTGALPCRVLGNVNIFLGRFERAKDFLERGVTLLRNNRESGDELSYMLGMYGGVHIYLGYFRRAEELTLESIAVARKIGHRTRISQGQIYLGIVYAIQGEWQKARASLEHGLEWARTDDNVIGTGTGTSFLGLTYLAEGDARRAVELIQFARDYIGRTGGTWTFSMIGAHLAEALLGNGDAAAALAVVRETLPVLEAGERWGQSCLELAAGRVKARLGDGDGARESFERALSTAELQESPTFAAKALLGTGAFMLRSGRTEEGTSAVARALSSFEELGMPWYAGRAQALLGGTLDESPCP
jgi:tetratricopeptide (TPR) repeat protein